MKVSDFKVGDKFYMNGYTLIEGKKIKILCQLISYEGNNQYMVATKWRWETVDGKDEVFKIKN